MFDSLDEMFPITHGCWCSAHARLCPVSVHAAYDFALAHHQGKGKAVQHGPLFTDTPELKVLPSASGP